MTPAIKRTIRKINLRLGMVSCVDSVAHVRMIDPMKMRKKEEMRRCYLLPGVLDERHLYRDVPI